MRDNIYEYFECKSNEELYSKFIAEDESVKELQQFYEVMSKELKKDTYQFRGINGGEEYLKKYNVAPRENTFTLVMLNNKNEALKWGNFPIAKDNKTILKSIFTENSARCIGYYHDEDFETMEKHQKYFKVIGLNITDNFIIDEGDKNIFYSSRQIDEIDFDNSYDYEPMKFNLKDEYYLDNQKEIISNENKLILTNKDLDISILEDINNLDNLNTFSTYYMEKMLEGMNIIEDEEVILRFLKVGLQNEYQEHLYLLSYDKENEINQVENISKGNDRATIIPFHKILNTYLQDDNKEALLVHNHPSGNPSQSEQDYASAYQILKLAKGIDKEFYDSYTIGSKRYEKASDHVLKISEEKNKIIDSQKEKQPIIKLDNDYEL